MPYHDTACTTHGRYNCQEAACLVEYRRRDSLAGGLGLPGQELAPGQLGLDTDGNLDIGLGGGLGIDLANGDTTIFGIDI